MPVQSGLTELDFDLPEQLIALRPVRPRRSARMMVWDRGILEHRQFSDLPALLREGDHLVFNDTRVIPAMLKGVRRRGGGQGGIAAISINLDQENPDGSWRVFARPARRLRAGDVIEMSPQLVCRVLARHDDHFIVGFDCPKKELEAVLASVGSIPLPPYILSRREADERDREDYQTVFARRPGAVAAPTASLHFDRWLLDRLAARGVTSSTITLHVGAGTFLPIRAGDVAGHRIHSEWGEISAVAANEINESRGRGNRIIAVGTTALRLLESAAGDGRVGEWKGDTDLFIRPGFRFRLADGLVTNFHLPGSTLILLVAAFLGVADMQHVYRAAIERQYRFYSYGDGSLLLRR